MRYYFVSVARSYVGGMSDEEIFEALNNNSFYQTEVYEHARNIALDIDNLTPNMLLQQIILEFKFYQKLITVGNIGDAMIRLDYLLDLANSMEDLGFTIIDFLEYLNSMIDTKTEIRYKEAKSDSDAVKIMNIHKSKGLEFPVCYFAGLYQSFNLRDLQSRFMVDPTYGILTPFYQDGIGTLFTKQLIKNKYLEEEIAEKIRLFYVALTRAKEKMIMVLPEFKEGARIKERATYLTEMKYRSFYDFLSSMSLNLKDYTRVVDVVALGLSKDYEYGKSKKMPTIESDEVMEVHPIFINKDVVNTTHASKTILNLISYEEARTMAYGTKIHEMLEETDYLVKNTNNKYVKQILDTFDFDNASIYQEFEFIFLRDEVEYHGIIDLMLEYDD